MVCVCVWGGEQMVGIALELIQVRFCGPEGDSLGGERWCEPSPAQCKANVPTVLRNISQQGGQEGLHAEF